MNLLIVSPFFESHRGGIEIVAGRLAHELQRIGHAVSWLAADTTLGPQSGDIRSVPIAVCNVVERCSGIPFPIPRLGALRRLRRAVQRADAVMLHDSLYLANVAAVIFARLAGKPILTVQHIGEVPYRNPLLRGGMRLANRVVASPMLATADQVVFISEVTARHFATARYRAAPQLIFNGVDTGIFRPADKAEARAGLGLPHDRPIALFVGRFVEKKGLHVIERMARMSPDVTWLLAGWGPIDPVAWQLPNVRVMPGLAGATLAPLYQASDVFVLPSTGEGFPLVVQEAMASGLPVVCGSDWTAADPEVAPLLHGVTVDTENSQDTAARFLDAARQAIRDSEADASLAGNLVRAATSRYDWSHAAALYAGMLEAIRRGECERRLQSSAPSAT